MTALRLKYPLERHIPVRQQEVEDVGAFIGSDVCIT